jgi:hypothetical protein
MCPSYNVKDIVIFPPYITGPNTQITITDSNGVNDNTLGSFNNIKSQFVTSKEQTNTNLVQYPIGITKKTGNNDPLIYDWWLYKLSVNTLFRPN